MDPAYVNQLWFLLGGALVGLFLTPGTIIKVAAALFAVALLGLILSAVFGGGGATWLFGLAAMAIPIVGALATVGAVLVSRVRAAVQRRARK